MDEYPVAEVRRWYLAYHPEVIWGVLRAKTEAELEEWKARK